MSAEVARSEFKTLVRNWGGEAPTAQQPAGEVRPVKLTIGLATYDDFDGAYFTVNAIRLYHREVLADLEIVILDNHPTGASAAELASMAEGREGDANVRYVPYDEVTSTAVRDVLFREARGEVVLVLDSHVLVAVGGIQALLAYYADPAHARDMVQGPLLEPNGQVSVTRMDPGWRDGMYGCWGRDDAADDPSADAFEIELHGLGLFAMRRDAWPGLSPWFRGFGGEEGYIHEKVRRAGGRVVCLPALGWHHRFLRPGGTPYPNRWSDRIHNYVTGWTEVGYDTAGIADHFAELQGEEGSRLVAEARRDVAHPLRCADGLVILSDDSRVAPWARMRSQLANLEAKAIRATVVVEGPDREAATCEALAKALAQARYRGWKRVLVWDEQWPLDLGSAHALAQLSDQHPDQCWVAVGQTGHTGLLPGPVLASTAQTEVAPTIDQWLDQLGATPITLSAPLASEGPPTEFSTSLDQIHILADAVTSEFWPRWHHWFSSRGWASDVRLLRAAERVGTSKGQDLRMAAARLLGKSRPGAPSEDAPSKDAPSEDTSAESGSLLLLDADCLALIGADEVLNRAEAELDGLDWDVLALGGGRQAVTLAPGRTLVGTRSGAHGGGAFVVSGSARGLLADILASDDLDEAPDPIGALLNRAEADLGLRVLSVDPPPFSPADQLRLGHIQSPFRHRYERPTP